MVRSARSTKLGAGASPATMPDAQTIANDEAALAIPGLLQVTPVSSTKSKVSWGEGAGWLVPRGIQHWERELSLVARSELTPELARKIRATLPSEQIAPRKYPWAARAVETSPVLPIASNLSADLRKEGIRVHTVGVDRVSSGFYYFAEGGKGDPVQVQGNLVEMLAPSLTETSTNAEIAALLEEVLDRLLGAFSGGILTELHAELADALPRLSRDGTGLVGTDLDAFEQQARALAERSARWESDARRLVDALVAAERTRDPATAVPLYREASREVIPPLDVQVGGKRVTLPERARWVVTGVPTSAPQPKVAPAAVSPAATPASLPAAAAAIPAPAPVAAPVAASRARPETPAPSSAVPSPRKEAPAAAAPGAAPAKPTAVVPIQPTAITMIGAPASTSDTEVPVAVAESTPPEPPPAPPPPAAAPVASAEASPAAPAPVKEEALPAEEKPARADDKSAKPRSPQAPEGRARARKAARGPDRAAREPTPAAKRNPATNLAFIVVLACGAIGYLVWQWMHHHGVHFHLPMH
jgi:hypothetical protein